jgi:hypothetical protein
VFPKKLRDVVKKKGKEKSAASKIVLDIERPHDDFQETLDIFQEAPLTQASMRFRCPLLL